MMTTIMMVHYDDTSVDDGDTNDVDDDGNGVGDDADRDIDLVISIITIMILKTT